MRLIALTIAVAAVVFLVFPQLDLALSAYFYEQGVGFPLRKNLVLQVIYYSVRVATLTTACTLVILAMARVRGWRHPLLASFHSLTGRHIAFLLVTVTLGPGLVVHQGIKEYYGRARPVNIEQFGGEKHYTPPFVRSDAGEKSFVSGHAAMSFWFTAFGLVAAGVWRKRLYGAGLAFGTLASATRVAQGGHFLSDVVFGALVVLLLNHLLAVWMLKREASCQPDASPRPQEAGGGSLPE